MKKYFALALVALLLLSVFAGCSGGRLIPAGETEATEAQPSAPTEAPVTELPETEAPVTIVGCWKYDVDFHKVMGLALAQSDSSDDATSALLTEYIPRIYDGVSFILVMDLKEDGSFVLTIDEDALNATAGKLDENLAEVIPDLLVSMTGMTREGLEAQLAASGMTMDDLIAQFGSQFNSEAMLESIKIPTTSGTYTYEDGVLLLTSEGKTTSYTVELSGSEMKITDIQGESGTIPAELLPLIFVR